MIRKSGQIAFNRSKRAEPIKYIVIHTTGNKNVGANAQAHFNYWNSGNVGQSADYAVDDTTIYKLNDYNLYYTWHCGDGKGKYGITNSNSIGIEICVNSDGDFNAAVDNAVVLVKELMRSLKIDLNHVVRHYDASRKNCPADLAGNNWSAWHDFKRRLAEPTELETVNDIVWELAERGIITDKALWLKKLAEDKNDYWLARKMVNYIRNAGV